MAVTSGPQKAIKYGYLYGPRCITPAWPLAASVVFKNTGGKFCDLDSSNRLTIAVAGQTDIKGWALAGEYTASATAGASTEALDISHFSVYGIPSDTAPAAGNLGESCDLVVASDVQKASISLSSEDVIHIIDYNATDSVVAVHLVTRNITFAGVV